MNEDTPLLLADAGNHNSNNNNNDNNAREVVVGHEQQQCSFLSWMTLSFVLGAAVATICVPLANAMLSRPFSTESSITEQPPPLLQLAKNQPDTDGADTTDSTSSQTINGVAPLPSQQEWCMAPGRYDFLGTYRSSATDDTAEEGILYSPGRFQGTLLTYQDDDFVSFHLVNMTYGNALSPHHHLPRPKDDSDLLDAFCTIQNQENGRESACYAPKHFPKGRYKHTQCAKLPLPHIPGFGLCRALAMAQLEPAGSKMLGQDVLVDEWRARLSPDDPDAPNEYAGELRIYLQDLSHDNSYWKVPLVHWLTSDDQSLEASFQVMNRREWDPHSVPVIPPGCEEAIDISTDAHRPETWSLDQDDAHHDHSHVHAHAHDSHKHHHHHGHEKIRRQLQLSRRSSSCPFGHLHRHLVLPTWHNHYHTTQNLPQND